MSRSNDISPRTVAAQVLHRGNAGTGGVSPAIDLSSTFARDENYELVGDILYSRYGGPNTEHLESVMARLDGGEASLAFASGLAASAALLETMKAGEHVAAPEIMYFGAQAWLKRCAARRGFDVTLYDQSKPGALESALRPGRTKILWVETPANPTWDVVDIEAAAQAGHKAGALVFVDSTVAPPCTTRPLDFGADIVFQAATKYLNGHSDLTAGILTAKKTGALWDEIREVRQNSGGVLPPFEAWLLMRGLRTLFVRFKAVSENAMAVAEALEPNRHVRRVLYPGLESHPGHAVAAKQMTGGFGGMMSILVDGDENYARRVSSKTRVFIPATSLGGVESLIEHRKTVEGPQSIIAGNLIRLSIGIEDAGDLIRDIEQALERAAR